MNNSDIVHMINRNIYPDFDANTRAVTSQNGLNRSDQAGCAILKEHVGEIFTQSSGVLSLPCRPIVIPPDDYHFAHQHRLNFPMCAYQGLTQNLQGVSHV